VYKISIVLSVHEQDAVLSLLIPILVCSFTITMHIPLLLSLAVLAYASPIQEKRQLQSSPAPSVTIKDGTVVGSSSGGIDTFNGIPFAQPPVGPLRLKRPLPLTATYGTIIATGTPTACPQFMQQVDMSNVPAAVAAMVLNSPGLQAATVTGEDCLTLNVQRPSTANSASKLPVLVWIYGGGFEFGSTQDYDASKIIQKSISLGKPIMFVAMNYRLGGFGFMAGKELKAEGNTNLGLRDQRLALQWVQNNIAAFGGDPTKVTIWGESAGSISVFDHTIINNGDASYNGGQLFRGAIMNSGSIIAIADVDTPKPQAVFNQVVQAAGCSGAANKLACLRALDYTTYLNAANSVPAIFGYRSVDLSYLPRPDPTDSFFSTSPEKAVAKNKYKKVPIIIGDQEDEGTLFSLSQNNISTTQQLTDYLASYSPTAPYASIANFVNLYPDDPSAGSPYNTGPLYNVYPQYKRLAAILGDIVFTLARRAYLQQVASKVPAWSYLATYLQGTPVVGTFHASDTQEIYKGLPLPEPASTIQTYYISFVNYLDPNTITTAAPLINWPNWDANTKLLMNFQQTTNTLMQDNFRQAAGDYIAANRSVFTV